MSEDLNRAIKDKIAARIVGKKILNISVFERTVTIRVEGDSVLELEFHETVGFAVKCGGWVFVPNRKPGRPKKKKAGLGVPPSTSSES